MPVGSARILGVSARTERLGLVVVEGGELLYYEGSAKGAESEAAAAAQLRAWLHTTEADVLVTEKPSLLGHKGGKQSGILETFVRIAKESSVVHVPTIRCYRHRNMYREAAHFAEQFPMLKELVPKQPKIWQKEPYRLVFFEALALVRDAGFLEE